MAENMTDTKSECITIRGRKISTLFSKEDIATRNLELAAQIAKQEFKNLLAISVLKGSFVFAADLIRALHEVNMEPEVEFITLSSYGAGIKGGEVKIVRDIDSHVNGRDVLLIDDIFESGNTLQFARDLMLERGARNVYICVLLDKLSRRKADLEADFVGFECPDYFVVGYGMDVGHAFRELPFVGVVEE
jgi:hypoxanthine phosphoribosyltransferase